MKNPTVSFIIPAYNAAATITRCLDSLAAQTLRDFEIIVVDDASLDDTAERVRRYTSPDEAPLSLTLLQQPHAGVSAARNRGLAAARGAYIQFIDADDYVLPEMAELLLGALQRENADVAVCGYDHPCLSSDLPDGCYDMSRPEQRYEVFQNAFTVQVPWNKLWRRECLTVPFDEGLGYCEDGLFCTENLSSVRRLVSISRPLYHYSFTLPQPGVGSCITRMGKAPITKETSFWFRMAEVYPRAEAKLRAAYGEAEASRLLSLRCFDFLLWELMVYRLLGADEHAQAVETEAVLCDPRFRRSIAMKEASGIRLREMNACARRATARAFVRDCAELARILDRGGSAAPRFSAYLCCFARYFIVRSEAPLDRSDLLARAYFEIQSGIGGAAQLVLSLCPDCGRKYVGHGTRELLRAARVADLRLRAAQR